MSFPRYKRYKESGVEWLGEVPAGWNVVPIKSAFRIVGGSTPKSDQKGFWDGEIVWVTPADLSKLQTLYVSDSQRKITQEGLSSCGTCLVPANSIVLSTRAPIGSLAISNVELCTNQGCKSLVPLGADAKYYAYLLGVCSTELNILGKGTTFLELSSDGLGAFKVPSPPLPEQQAIATFLDREVAKIDALIAEQQRLIALLIEKRQAVISHAVTKGLNPDAPMKDSGVEWAGVMPSDWKIISLGKITSDKCDGPFGSGLKSEHYTDSGVRVVRLQNIRRDGFDDTDSAFIGETYYKEQLNGHDVQEGDLLIAGLGDERNTVGRACVAPLGIEPAMVKADCFRFRLDSKRALSQFIAFQLTAGAVADAGLFSSGSTRSRISLSIMASRKILLPPIEMQRQVVDFLKKQSVIFDELVAEAQRAIILLQERRAALISAAVSGKIDVRGLAVEEGAA